MIANTHIFGRLQPTSTLCLLGNANRLKGLNSNNLTILVGLHSDNPKIFAGLNSTSAVSITVPNTNRYNKSSSAYRLILLLSPSQYTFIVLNNIIIYVYSCLYLIGIWYIIYTITYTCIV